MKSIHFDFPAVIKVHRWFHFRKLFLCSWDHFSSFCHRHRSLPVWLTTSELLWSGNFFWKDAKSTWRCRSCFPTYLTNHTSIWRKINCFRSSRPLRRVGSEGWLWNARWQILERWNSVCQLCSRMCDLHTKYSCSVSQSATDVHAHA